MVPGHPHIVLEITFERNLSGRGEAGYRAISPFDIGCHHRLRKGHRDKKDSNASKRGRHPQKGRQQG